MPRGFIIVEVMKDRSLNVLFKYPEDIKADLDELRRIYYTHKTSIEIYVYNFMLYFFTIVSKVILRKRGLKFVYVFDDEGHRYLFQRSYSENED